MNNRSISSLHSFCSALLCAAALWAWSGVSSAANLIINADFSAGATSFTSAYTDMTGSGLGLYGAATYAITSDPFEEHDDAASYFDHTSGNASGAMMAVNGAGVAGVVVWQQVVTVTPATIYDFSAWLSSWTSASPATMNFTVNGSTIGSLAANGVTQWVEFVSTWNSGGSTTATIRIVNTNTAELGNDFALDDLYFGPQLPRLTSVAPLSGPLAGGTVVTLTGTGFTGATNVTFDGTAATNRTVVNATTITCTTPLHAAGPVSVKVTTPAGTNPANTLFTYGTPPPAPTLTSVAPNTGTTAGGTVVTLTGTNFTGATGVTFGGTAATIYTVNSATSITCTTPVGTAGTASVRVTTPGGTNPANTLFTYVAPPPPANDNFAAAQLLTGSSGNVTGSNVSATKEPGEANHADDVGGRSVWYLWTAPTSSLATIDTLGSNFDTLLAVYTGTAVGSLTVVASNDDESDSVQQSKLSFNAVAGTTYRVAVDGYTGLAGTVKLNYSLTIITPNTGTTAGGTAVTLTGTNFTGATGVTFGGTAATSFLVTSATTITCTTPGGAAGTANVVVTTPGGTNAANTLFTYGAPPSPPTLTSVSPPTGTTAGGTTVTLTGTGFTGAPSVTFGGNAATSVIVVNATTITCTTPAGTAGTASVRVTTPGGTNAANTLFTYGAPPVVFGAVTNFPAGTNPISVAVDDLNGDGRDDLAVANWGSNTVSIRLGTGTGSFGTAANFPVGTNPSSVSAGDLNGDDTPDLAVANFGSNNVPILLGDGAGSFAAATNFTAGTNPVWAAVGDLNGDGNPDLAVANYNSNNVSIRLGNGAGSFAAAANFPVGTKPRYVAVTDLNGDGKPDLAVANETSNNVSILLGNGAGSFGAATNFAVGTAPYAVAVSDFDGDGKPDLAVANYNSNNVSILPGNGAGSFGAATNFTAGTNPSSVAVDDLNGDGKPDLAVANAGSNNVSILLGNGAGSFGAATNLAVGTAPRSVAVGDFNGDGKPDLAVANHNSNNVSILLNLTYFAPTLATAAYTGLDPTPNGGVLYGFPSASATQSSPATLTVTSTSAGTVLSGSNAVAGNNTNTGFRTDINLTLNQGESVVAQTISLAVGSFDDGLRFDYNGQTVLDFDFSNYNGIPAVNSMFGGGWSPWTGEGSPIVLELDASGLRLMVTATSNGTGTAAGVVTGQRVNVLSYFTPDTYVPNPADPDFVSGVQIGLYNRNHQGPWAIPNVTLTATARVIASLPPFRITAFSYNPTARTVNLTFLSEPAVNYTIETSPDGQTWTVLGAQVAGAAAATSTTVTGRSLSSLPVTRRLLLRVRRP